MSEKLTIKEIAEIAGVSVSTVSVVLNGKKGASEETRKRILSLIDNTNYIPNANSRRLILKRSFNILLAYNPNNASFSSFFYSAVTNSIVESGSKLGYNIILTTIPDSFTNSMIERTLLQHDADGIIFLHDISNEIHIQLNKMKVPFVVVDSHKISPIYPNVRGDYITSAYVATRHLIENGHKKIAFIGTNYIPDHYNSTFEGYKKALTESNFPIKPEWIQSNAYDELTAQKCIQNILESNELPTAVFCSGDLFAISIMNYLQNIGYNLPDDFSICGLDDMIMAHYHYPALTTVRIDEKSMGNQALNMLDKLINNVDTEINIIVQSDQLIIRNSVKKIV